MECQLASPIVTPGNLLSDDRWGMSQKFDGKRLVVKVDEHVIGYNRRGVRLESIPGTIENALDGAEGWTLDGELIEDVYYVFDLLKAAGKSVKELPLIQRVEGLRTLVNMINSPYIQFVELWTTTDDKLKKYHEALNSGVEGVILKKLSAPYVEGKNTNYLKCKFVKDVDCVVGTQDKDGKQNFELFVYKGDIEFPVGKVSRLTGDGPRVKVGDVVTVECLYVSDSYNLVQPVSPRLRTDKIPTECSFEQLADLKTRKDYIL